MDSPRSEEQPIAPTNTGQGRALEAAVHISSPARLDGSAEGPRYRAITHVAVITAFLLPFAVLPYALSRRRISRLSREVQELTGTVNALRSELKAVTGEISKRKEDQNKLRMLVQDLLQDVDELKFKGKVHSDHIAHLSSSAEQRIEHRNREIGKVKDDLWRLLQDNHRLKSETAVLAALGTSLADVAAFMHEVELEMGMPPARGKGDSRGINRLREVAAVMARLNKSNSTGDKGPSGKQTS